MLDILDRKLDMSLYFSSPIQDPGPPFPEGRSQVPMDLHVHEGSMYFDFFVDRKMGTDYDFYKYYNPIIYGGYVLIAQRIEWPELDKVRRTITSIPTFVLGGLYTQENRVMMDFRFHNSDLQKVEGLVKVIASINADVRISYLGRSGGLLSKLGEMEGRARMSVARFYYGDDSGMDDVIEWKGIAEPYAAVSYGRDGKGEVKRVDISSTPIMPFLMTLIRDQIPIVGYFEHRRNGAVDSTAIFPSFLVKPFLVRYFEKTGALKGIRLQYVESYEDVKDSI